MKQSLAHRLHFLDNETLTHLARRATGHDQAVVVAQSVQATPMAAGLGAEGIARLHGQARIDGQDIIWSLICKAIRADTGATSHEPTAWNYWQREVLAYQSNLLTDLPPSIRAPRSFGITKQSAHEYWLWLEDIDGFDGRTWSIADFGMAAKQLGQFNGAYLTGRALPRFSWLSRARVAMWMQFASQQIALDKDAAPIEKTGMARDPHKRVIALWQQRTQMLHKLNSLPRCLCHHDAMPRNLVRPGTDNDELPLIAIDWAMAGVGRIGQDVAAMLGGALALMDADVADAQTLDQIIFPAYLAGLREAGWRGHADLARSGYCATLGLVWGVGLHCFARANLNNQDWQTDVERVSGHSFQHYCQQVIGLVDFALDRGEEALQLFNNFPDDC